ncbi:uncharacterized protein LOC143034596 isoform X2 [Oratosquilla oratoria]
MCINDQSRDCRRYQEATKMCAKISRKEEYFEKIRGIHSNSLRYLQRDLGIRYQDIFKTSIYHPDVLIVSSNEMEDKAKELQKILRDIGLSSTGVFDSHTWAIADFWTTMHQRSTAVVYLMTQSLVNQPDFHYYFNRVHYKPVVNVLLEDEGRQIDAPMYTCSPFLHCVTYEQLPKYLDSIFKLSRRACRYTAEMEAITNFIASHSYQAGLQRIAQGRDFALFMYDKSKVV